MIKIEDINKSFINGEWVEGRSGNTYELRDPYDHSLVTNVRLANAEQLEDTFKIAEKAQREWANVPADERKDILQKAFDYLKENQEEIVKIMVRDSGSTVFKANFELQISMDELKEAIHSVDELYKVKELPSGVEGKVNKVHRLPLGVISSITPFNFPMNLSMRTIAPAIALGNAVVHKPAIEVGLSGGQIIARAFEHAGLPKGVFNSILTSSKEIGDGMVTNPIPRLISFTGSTPVGRHIGKIAGENLKRVALELGGNAPIVVLGDADVDQAVDAAIFGNFIHNGQICMITNRIIVHQDIYGAFVEKFLKKAKELKAGDPKDPSTVIGPVINEQQADKIIGFVEQAKKDGLKLALEGERYGNLISPFVFVDVPNDSALAQTELFGPIAQIIPAASDEQAIAYANDTEYGLSSAVFTSDLDKGQKLALQIDAGMTHVNDQTVNAEAHVAFGGNKASGLGRFGHPWIVDEFTTTKWVSVQEQPRKFPF